MMNDNNFTKQLGFGCVRLTYHLTYRQAVSNLQTAFDSGIAHFDVARLYGFGTAEKILGTFIKDKRDKVTITSKFGYYPGNPWMGNLYIQNAARFAFRMLKKLPAKKAAQGAANEIVLHKNFNVADAQQSLETSLKALQTDYIDFYLLHEPTVSEACQPEIIDFLERQKQKGLIREYGLGSFANKIENDISKLPEQYNILQSDCSFPFDFPLLPKDVADKQLFFFSPFRYYQSVKNLLEKDNPLAREISDILNCDIHTKLLDLFLLHQLYSPFRSTTLFTSSHNSNIQNTISHWFSLQQKPLADNSQFEIVQQLIQSKLKSVVM